MDGRAHGECSGDYNNAHINVCARCHLLRKSSFQFGCFYLCRSYLKARCLMMESSYLNLGVTSEILNRLIQVMLAVTTYDVLYTFAFLRNSIQQLIVFRTNPEQNYDKLIC